MVTTNQKPITDQQKLKRKEHKHTTIENHQITRQKKKNRTDKNYKNNPKTSNKVAVSIYLSII